MKKYGSSPESGATMNLADRAARLAPLSKQEQTTSRPTSQARQSRRGSATVLVSTAGLTNYRRAIHQFNHMRPEDRETKTWNELTIRSFQHISSAIRETFLQYLNYVIEVRISCPKRPSKPVVATCNQWLAIDHRFELTSNTRPHRNVERKAIFDEGYELVWFFCRNMF